MDKQETKRYEVTRIPGTFVDVPIGKNRGPSIPHVQSGDNHGPTSLVWVTWPNGRVDAIYRSSILDSRGLAAYRTMEEFR